MRPSLREVAARTFDVIVIGGGINGMGIARAAQRRGHRTLLVERNDFASGTTSRATRLIHGGLRYLEHRELGLVSESLGEREALLREYPQLVRPLRLLVPVYDGDDRPGWKVRAGLALYDLLSPRKSLPRHRAIPLGALDGYEPALSREGLRAAYAFYDAQVEFPERIVIETLRDFTAGGGVALNHAEAARLVSPGGVLRAVAIRDAVTGEEAEVGVKVAVNAAGPWVDQVLRGSDAERHDPLIGGTKGSHLVAAWPEGPRHAVFASAQSDGRPFFILPWYRYTLVGTTDLRYDGDPSAARCTPDELRYLLEEATRLFPSTPLRRAHVLYTYCGVRPLPHTPGGKEGAITRKHFVVDHVKRGGPKGLLSIVGGKLTTYRSLAAITVKAIERQLDAGGGTRDAGITTTTLQPPAASLAASAIDASPICAHNPETLADVARAVDEEQAVTLADVLLRRLPAGWSACHALDGAERVAKAMAERLGWPSDRIPHEVAAYERELRETLVPVEAIDAAAPPVESEASPAPYRLAAHAGTPSALAREQPLEFRLQARARRRQLPQVGPRARLCRLEECRVRPDGPARVRVVLVTREEVPVQVRHAVAEQFVVQLAWREGPEHPLGDDRHFVEERRPDLRQQQVQLRHAGLREEDRVAEVVLVVAEHGVPRLQLRNQVRVIRSEPGDAFADLAAFGHEVVPPDDGGRQLRRDSPLRSE